MDRIDDSFRPVNLRKVVLGFPCTENSSEFRFDMMLSYRLANIIQTYAELKPTLVVINCLFFIFLHQLFQIGDIQFYLVALLRQRYAIIVDASRCICYFLSEANVLC